MDLFNAIRHRRAIRHYTTAVVDDALIGNLIEISTWAPSAMNRQPWMFTVVKGRKRLAALSAQSKAFLLQTMKADDPILRLREQLTDPGFDIFYGAPQLIVISATAEQEGCGEDCAMAAQTLMLAAYASGLGTCWIGLARPWLNTPAGKNGIELPAACIPVAPIIIGHPQGVPDFHPRNTPQVHWIGEPAESR
jgi:nitroreductase